MISHTFFCEFRFPRFFFLSFLAKFPETLARPNGTERAFGATGQQVEIDREMDEAQTHIYNYRSPRESIDSDSSARVDLKNLKVPSITIANCPSGSKFWEEGEIERADKSVNLCGPCAVCLGAFFRGTGTLARRPWFFDGHSG